MGNQSLVARAAWATLENYGTAEDQYHGKGRVIESKEFRMKEPHREHGEGQKMADNPANEAGRYRISFCKVASHACVTKVPTSVAHRRT